MGVNCYCNYQSEQGSIPVPPLDKTIDVSNNVKNIDELNRQESYNRIFSINKNDLKTIQSIKKENEDEKNNNNIKEIENNKNDNNDNDDNNNIIKEEDSNFNKKINSISTQITEEKFNSFINEKIKEIELKFGQINQDKKKEYMNNKDKNLVFKSPLFFKETNISYYGSWNPTEIKKEGWGILIDKDGNKYERGWKNDSIEGYGRII